MTTAQKDRTEVKNVKEFLRCELTKEELANYSKESARAYSAKARLEGDLEGIKKRKTRSGTIRS